MIDTYKFSTLEYKRPDLEARRAKLAEWKNAAVHAASYAALRALMFEIDRETCELFTQYSIAHIRHTLDTRDEFYETEIAYLQDTLPTLSGAEVELSEAIASSPFRPDIEQEFGKQYFVSMDLQKKLYCEANGSAAPAGEPSDQRVSEDHGHSGNSVRRQDAEPLWPAEVF